MSAASFLGIAGLVSLSGFDGLIYSIGFLVGWPVVMFLIAEPLRNLGKYTFADVVAFRLRQAPVRVAAAIGSLAVVSFYLIAQMVGAGNAHQAAVRPRVRSSRSSIVGVVMLAYVLFGGMMATTWVQIIKAVLLLSGAFLLAVMALSRFGIQPAGAVRRGVAISTASRCSRPGRLVSNPLDAMSLGLALMLGTAGLPHILMRFYTVQDAKTARLSVSYATAFIGFFYLLTFILGFGAMVLVGQPAIRAIDAGGNMAAPLLAKAVGGEALSRLHLRRGVCDDSRRRRRADAGRRRDAVARPVGERRAPRRGVGARAVARGARVDRRARRHWRSCWGLFSRGRTSRTWWGWRLRLPRARIFRRSCCRCSGASSRRARRR